MHKHCLIPETPTYQFITFQFIFIIFHKFYMFISKRTLFSKMNLLPHNCLYWSIRYICILTILLLHFSLRLSASQAFCNLFYHKWVQKWFSQKSFLNSTWKVGLKPLFWLAFLFYMQWKICVIEPVDSRNESPHLKGLYFRYSPQIVEHFTLVIIQLI